MSLAEKIRDNKLTRQEVLAIAFPAVLESLFNTFTSIIDSTMVSALGTAAISAIAVTTQPKLFIFAVFFAINTAVSSLTAYYNGKKDSDGANRIFVTAIFAVIIASIVLGLLSIAAAKPMMMLFSGQKDTLDMSIAYFRIVMGGMIFNMLFMLINSALRGCGNTKVTLSTNIVSCVLDVIFNYLLIEGHFGFPALGIKGAAIGTVAGTIGALVVAVIYLLKSRALVDLGYCIKKKIKPSRSALSEIFALWKSVVVENLMTRVGTLFTSSITARAGSFAMSLYSVGMNLMNINFSLGNGFQAASVALIGKSKGEGNVDDIKRYSKRILVIGLTLSIILAILMVIFAKPYFGLYSNEEEFIRMGCISSFIIAIVAPIQVVKIIYSGFLQGLGHMKETMKSSIMSVTIAQPICTVILVVVLDLGLIGIWISVLLAQLIWLISMRGYYVKVSKEFF